LTVWIERGVAASRVESTHTVSSLLFTPRLGHILPRGATLGGPLSALQFNGLTRVGGFVAFGATPAHAETNIIVAVFVGAIEQADLRIGTPRLLRFRVPRVRGALWWGNGANLRGFGAAGFLPAEGVRGAVDRVRT